MITMSQEEAMAIDGAKWGPTSMPKVRDLFDVNVDVARKVDAPRGMKIPENLSENSHLFYGSADFTDLHTEIRRDADKHMLSKLVQEGTADLISTLGMSGAFYMAFDPNRQPEIIVDKQFKHWPPEESSSDWSIRQHPQYQESSFMQVKGLSLHWWCDEEDELDDGSGLPKFTFRAFAQICSAGRSYRTANYPSSTCSEAVLIAWMATSRGLRMVNKKTQNIGMMVPPRVRKELKMTKRAQQSKVTVVSLRQAERGQLAAVREAESRHLNHRFIVRGHWRQQPYGKDRAERRLTYIAPFVKGPDGAPFMSAEKVYKW